MEAKTPKILWASTPTPKASAASTYSFALPETSGKLNAEATTFMPSEKLQPGRRGYTRSRFSQSENLEVAEIHAEAQAVMMAESVLGLDSESKQVPIGPVARVMPMKAAGAEMRTEDQTQLHRQPLPMPSQVLSKGSTLHQQGQCRPCAWMWKPRGCQNADTCEYCHLCPEGELKHRKKLKIAAIRMGALGPSTDKAGMSRRGLKLSSLL